jgi:electron transport complex protein RnfE
MGIAATFVLLGSNIIISSIRKFIPDQVRIPCFIVIIATFVTIVELTMKAYAPELSKALGIFVPLIVVNCIVLGRAEAFACKEGVFASMLDALGMGVGFTLALLLISVIREALGNGTLFGLLIVKSYEPVLYLVLAPGALLVIGLLIAGINFLARRKAM